MIKCLFTMEVNKEHPNEGKQDYSEFAVVRKSATIAYVWETLKEVGNFMCTKGKAQVCPGGGCGPWKWGRLTRRGHLVFG